MSVQTLIAIRAHLEALQIQVDGLIAAETEAAAKPAGCPHRNQVDLSTMGLEQWQCRDCGYQHRRELNAAIDGGTMTGSAP